MNAVLAHGFGGLIEGSPSIGFAWRQPNASATTEPCQIGMKIKVQRATQDARRCRCTFMIIYVVDCTCRWFPKVLNVGMRVLAILPKTSSALFIIDFSLTLSQTYKKYKKKTHLENTLICWGLPKPRNSA